MIYRSAEHIVHGGSAAVNRDYPLGRRMALTLFLLVDGTNTIIIKLRRGNGIY